MGTTRTMIYFVTIVVLNIRVKLQSCSAHDGYIL